MDVCVDPSILISTEGREGNRVELVLSCAEDVVMWGCFSSPKTREKQERYHLQCSFGQKLFQDIFVEGLTVLSEHKILCAQFHGCRTRFAFNILPIFKNTFGIYIPERVKYT